MASRSALFSAAPLLLLTLTSGVACQSPPVVGKGPESPVATTAPIATDTGTAAVEAPPAVRDLGPATRERAGAADCTLDAPSDLATEAPDATSVLGLGTKVVFGATGGLVVWQGKATEGRARPIGTDGRPTGAVQTFPVEKSFFNHGLVAFEGGFAAVIAFFDVQTLGNRYFVQAFSAAGEARGVPVQLPVGDHFFEGMSEGVAGRFVVLAGPNQAKALQAAKAIVVHIDVSGAVRLEEKPLAITAPVATRPAVAFALSPEHWAMTVQVPSGPDTLPFLLGGQSMQRVQIKGLPKLAGNQGKLGGIHAVVVDGEMHAIQGDGAGSSIGLLSAANRYEARWAGKDLAVQWAGRDDAGKTRVSRAWLSPDGKLRPENGQDDALRRALADRVSVDFMSGGGEGTVLTRVTQSGGDVGNPTRLDGALPDVGKDTLTLDIGWSGDRFVIAHEVSAGGKTVIRTAGLRCGGDAK